MRQLFQRLAVTVVFAALAQACQSSTDPTEGTGVQSGPLVSANGAITNRADETRSGWYPNQPALNPAIVAGPTFGRLFATELTLAANEQVFAQPLVYGSSVFVVTESNNIYTLDSQTGAITASRSLGPAFNAADVQCGDLTPTIGITGTPVIDTSTGTAYFFSKTYNAATGAAAWYAHAVDAQSLDEKPNFPIEITGAAANDETVTFAPAVQQQRAGLLLMNGVVYAGFGSQCDFGNYHGYVVGIGTTGGIKTIFATEAGPGSAHGAGIWQSGSGLVSDRSGQILFTTANGYSNALVSPLAGTMPNATLDESVVRLAIAPDGSLTSTDFFSPYDSAYLDDNDVDFGSGGFVALADSFGAPGHPHLALAGGKQGILYLLDRDNLGGFQQGPNHGDAVLGATNTAAGLWSTPAVWAGDGGWVYATGNQGPLQAFAFGLESSGVPALTAVGATVDAFGYGSGSPIVTSDGSTSGSGLVWVTYATGSYGAGELRAYDAVPDGSGNMVLRFEDAYGRQAKFSTPGVGDGRIYVGSSDGHVLGYGSPATPTFSGAPFDFGSVVAGQSTQALLIPVTANQATTVTAISASSAAFTVTSSALPLSMAAGDTLKIPVTFSPTAVEQYVAALNITSSAGPGAISIRGTGQSSTGLLSASPTSLSFGGVAVGQSSTNSIILTNVGSLPLTFESVALPGGPFSFASAPTSGQTLASGASVSVPVTFTPSGAGTFTGTVQFATDSGTMSTYVSGASAAAGYLEVQTLALDFGIVQPGSSKALSFSIYNGGGLDITMTKSKPPSLGTFVAQTSLAEGTVIAAGATVVEEVSFSPMSDGLFTDQWTLTGSDGATAQNVTMRGFASNGTGLLGQYFTSQDLSGSPSVSRVDPEIAFDWSTVSPDPSIAQSSFSVRWTGQIVAAYTELYTFYTTSDDGIRVSISGQPIINDWTNHTAMVDAATIPLLAGQSVPITVEYYQAGLAAVAELDWSSPSTPREIVPTDVLYPAPGADVFADAGSGADSAGEDAAGDASSPNASGGPDASSPNASGGPDASSPDASASADASSPDASGGPDASSPDASASADASNPDASVNANALSPDASASANASSPNASASADASSPNASASADASNASASEGDANSGGDAPLAEVSGSGENAPTLDPLTLESRLTALLWLNGIARVEEWAPHAAPTTPAPAATSPASSMGDGLTGNYFSTIALTPPALLTRVDPVIDFNWTGTSPSPAVNQTNFSVSWTGEIRARYTEIYTFVTESAGGIRVFVNGSLIIDDFTNHVATIDMGSLALVAGQLYPIEVDYYQGTGGSVAQLSWSSPSTPSEIVPQSQLYSH